MTFAGYDDSDGFDFAHVVARELRKCESLFDACRFLVWLHEEWLPLYDAEAEAIEITKSRATTAGAAIPTTPSSVTNRGGEIEGEGRGA